MRNITNEELEEFQQWADEEGGYISLLFRHGGGYRIVEGTELQHAADLLEAAIEHWEISFNEALKREGVKPL